MHHKYKLYPRQLINIILSNSKRGQTPMLISHTMKEPLLLVVLLDFSLTVKAATLIFISGRGSAISSAKEGKSGFIYNLVNS